MKVPGDGQSMDPGRQKVVSLVGLVGRDQTLRYPTRRNFLHEVVTRLHLPTIMGPHLPCPAILPGGTSAGRERPPFGMPERNQTGLD